MTTSRILSYGALGLPLAFAALPIYVHVPRFYADIAGIWSPDETTYDKTGPLEVLDMPPDPGPGSLKAMEGSASSFTPDYAPEEILEIARRLYTKAK